MKPKKTNKKLVVICCISLLLFLMLLLDVLKIHALFGYDILINESLESVRNPVLNRIMILITSIANYQYMLLLSAILFFLLIYKKKAPYSALLVVSLLAGFLLESVIKLLIQRARPINSVILESTYSFPSGHAAISVIFFSLLIYSFKDDIKNKSLKILFIIINIILISLISFSRMYLGVHWFSDVLAGLFLGAFLVSLIILLFKKHLKTTLPSK